MKSLRHFHLEVNHCGWEVSLELDAFSSFTPFFSFDFHTTNERFKTWVVLLPTFGMSLLFVFVTFVCVLALLGGLFFGC